MIYPRRRNDPADNFPLEKVNTPTVQHNQISVFAIALWSSLANSAENRSFPTVSQKICVSPPGKPPSMSRYRPVMLYKQWSTEYLLKSFDSLVPY